MNTSMAILWVTPLKHVTTSPNNVDYYSCDTSKCVAWAGNAESAELGCIGRLGVSQNILNPVEYVSCEFKSQQERRRDAESERGRRITGPSFWGVKGG
jgi:hypothetical protein